MRKLMRNIARANMAKKGVQRMNRKQIDNVTNKRHSFFAKHWREYV